MVLNNVIPVIILNWNGIDDTKECIDSVLLTRSVPFHIYLLDNGSAEDEGLRLEEMYRDHRKITVIRYNENLGFTGAHNRVWSEELSHEDHAFIALLNNDTSVEPEWLAELHRTACDSNADMVAAKMIKYYNRDKLDNAGHRMLSTGEIIPIGHNDPPDLHSDRVKTLGACAGAALYSTAMLQKIGFFDPYFSTGYEDAELGLRAIVTGHKCIYAPRAIVYHKVGRSVSKVFNEDYSLMIHSGILYSYFKCMPLRNILLALPSFIFKYCSMFVIDILFLRFKFLRILVLSWKNLIQNKGDWRAKRKTLANMRIPYLKHPQLISFFWFDVNRFWNILVLRKNSNIDVYGN